MNLKNCYNFNDFRRLAKKMDITHEQFSWSDEECLKNYVDWDAPACEGITLDTLKEKGFALLCVAYPKSDLHIIVGDEVEENLYNNQFGKYQK